MSRKDDIAEAGWRKLHRDVQLDGPPDTRTEGVCHKADAADEQQLAAELTEAGVGRSQNVPLPELLRRFRENRLYEE